MCRRQVELAVIAAGAPRPVFLADHGDSERRMMPATSSSWNSASAWRSLSGPGGRALANTGRPAVSIVWRILCFGDDFPFQSPTMAGKEANKERTVCAME
jgi:hypothetical protein